MMMSDTTLRVLQTLSVEWVIGEEQNSGKIG